MHILVIFSDVAELDELLGWISTGLIVCLGSTGLVMVDMYLMCMVMRRQMMKMMEDEGEEAPYRRNQQIIILVRLESDRSPRLNPVAHRFQ